MTSTSKLKPPAALLLRAITDDTHEESAQDFLDDNAIPYATHNRQALITLAWQHGWRPTP